MSLSESTSALIPLIHLTSQLEELLMVGNPFDLLGFGMTSRIGKWAALWSAEQDASASELGFGLVWSELDSSSSHGLVSSEHLCHRPLLYS